jgi:hypothetical protein
MIRRTAAKDFLLISQTDHAAFSGFLAKHIGNDQFSSVDAEVIAAIAHHDTGWPLHDDSPTLNAAGLPLHVFETPAPLAIRIWSASVDRAMDLGPYAALLVSLHQLALSDFVTMNRQSATPRDVFEMNKFQHRQIERQEALRKAIGMRTDVPLHLGLAAPGVDSAEDRLRFHFRLLTLCDRLSLELCCGTPLFPVIEGILPRPGGAAVTVQTNLMDDRVMRVDPWPFDGERLSAEVPCRRVPSMAFEAEEEFRAAFATAPIESVRFELEGKAG